MHSPTQLTWLPAGTPSVRQKHRSITNTAEVVSGPKTVPALHTRPLAARQACLGPWRPGPALPGERLGETATRTANVRVIAATNHDLKHEVAQGVFREDLYYRLAVISVEMPPLRQRPLDILRLAEHYLQHFAKRTKRSKHYSPEARASICAHSWPGNLRELRNVVERAVILSRDEMITPLDLPPELKGADGDGPAPAGVGALVSLDALEREHIRLVVERTTNMSEAAGILGIDAATLYRKRKRFGFD